MIVLLLWNRDKEDGWLSGDLSFVVNDLTTDCEAACKEVQEKVPASYFDEFFKDDIYEKLQEYGYSGKEQTCHTFRFDNINYKGYTFNFVFKDSKGESISFTKECSEFIEPFNK